MKTIVLLLLTLVLATPSGLLAAIGTITTLTGKTYRKCEIVRVHPDGVSFTHSNGAAKVLFMDLTPSLRGKLGYSPSKAAAYEKEIAARRQRETEARAARQTEMARALNLAQELELTRLRIAEQQASAAARATSLNYGAPAAVQYPFLPVLGAVYDSRDYRYGPRSYARHHGWRYGQQNGVWYDTNSGVYPFLGTSHGIAPACPPTGIGFKKGSFSFQISP